MTDKPWVANKPEQRFSIAVDRFLRRTLLPPCYMTAISDADGVKRTENARMRDRNRGIKGGQLDWDVVQGDPFLARKLELKRGGNDLSTLQRKTIADLTACGAPPIVAWDLVQVYVGLSSQGFRFSGNVSTILAEMIAHLAAWDREADAILAGTLKKKKAAPRKAPPRFLMGKRTVARLRKSGIRV